MRADSPPTPIAQSKKIAENPDVLVLDVKTGRGAFLKTFDESVALAQVMVCHFLIDPMPFYL